LWLRPYEILATGSDCGIIEFVSDTLSLDEIHRTHGTLNDYFEAKYGRKSTKTYRKAQKNFM
jgi:phosphatidylinositol 4-kinase